jgi:GntR family transcriptional regulator, phosphonate transport system regulatory protein
MTLPRTPIWKSIAGTLAEEIARGHWAMGERLPTEAELSARFGVNRHTVRRSLAALGEEGLVHSRRGAGVFVAGRPTDYPIGRRVRFHQNLRAAGRLPGKEILTIATRMADAEETEALALTPRSEVHAYEGLSLADGHPIALFRSVFPAGRFPDLARHLVEEGSVTASLARGGVADYTRASTRLTAVPATATQGLHLRLPEGAPLLRSVSLNVDAAGRPVEFGHTWFAGDRVTLTVEPE